MSLSAGRLHPPRSGAARSHSPAPRQPRALPASWLCRRPRRGWLRSQSRQSALSCHAPWCTGRSQLLGQSPQHPSSPLRRAHRGSCVFSLVSLKSAAPGTTASCPLPRALPTGTCWPAPAGTALVPCLPQPASPGLRLPVGPSKRAVSPQQRFWALHSPTGLAPAAAPSRRRPQSPACEVPSVLPRSRHCPRPVHGS